MSVVSRDTWLFGCLAQRDVLCTKAVEGLALTLESVDHIEGRDRLATSMLSVGDGILDNVVKEGLEDTAGFLVHQAGDTLDTASTGQTADGGLRNALDVVTQHLAMALGTTLSAFTSLSATRHWIGVSQMQSDAENWTRGKGAMYIRKLQYDWMFLQNSQTRQPVKRANQIRLCDGVQDHI